MGSNVRDLVGFGRRGGKVAVIAGAAAAFLSTGTATAANMTPTPPPAVRISHHSAASGRDSYKPRPGSGRDAVQLGPARAVVAGRLVPGRPSLERLIVR
jgi:hypothetical protein